MPIEVKGHKISIAEAARRARMPYSRVWGLLTGGLQRVRPEELERLEQVLRQLLAEAADEAGGDGE